MNIKESYLYAGIDSPLQINFFFKKKLVIVIKVYQNHRQSSFKIFLRHCHMSLPQLPCPSFQVSPTQSAACRIFFHLLNLGFLCEFKELSQFPGSIFLQTLFEWKMDFQITLLRIIVAIIDVIALRILVKEDPSRPHIDRTMKKNLEHNRSLKWDMPSRIPGNVNVHGGR